MRVTRHGQILAEHAERALEELLMGIRAVRAEADPDTGTVVLGFMHAMGPSLIPALLRTFRKVHPRMTIQLFQGASVEVLGGVAEGRLDVGVTALLPPLPAPLRAHRLAEQQVALLVPADHPLANGAKARLADVADEPLITMIPGYGLRTLTDELLRTAGLPVRYAFECQEAATASGLVSAGLGVALLPVGNRVEDTVELEIDDASASLPVAVIWSHDQSLSAPAAALRTHITTTAPALLHAATPNSSTTPGPATEPRRSP